MQITSISEAKATLSKLVEKVLHGEEIIIGKAGKPVAKLVPYHLDPAPRELGVGSWRSNVWIANDFDDQSDEILNLFLGAEGEHESIT